MARFYTSSSLRIIFGSTQTMRCHGDGGRRVPQYPWKWSPRRQQSSEPKPMSELPGPPSYPFVGSLPNYMPILGSYDLRYFDESQMKKREQYGPIIKEHLVPGDPPFVMVFDPDDIEAFYRQEGRTPTRSPIYPITAYREKRGLPVALSAESSPDEWLRFRSAVNKPSLSPRVVSSYLPSHSLIADQLVHLIRHLRDEKGEVSDFHNVLRRWSMESIGVVLFEEQIGTLQLDLSPSSEAQQFIDSSVTYFGAIWKTYFLWIYHKSQKTKTWKELEESADKISLISKKHMDAMIKRLDENPKGLEDSFLAKLMTNSELTYDDVLVVVSEFFTGGVDTTSNAMAFALYQLAMNPDKAAFAQTQVQKVMSPGDKITTDVINKLPFVKGIVKEALRMHPVANTIPRTTQKDVVIGGYLIPKGIDVMLVTSVAGRREEYFDAPEEFRPERWVRGEEGEAPHHPFASLPFGHGPRMCIGRRFAEQELYVGLIKILANFDIAYPYEPLRCELQLVNIPDKPLRFQFTDRS